MIVRYIVFFGIALLILGQGHVYLYRRLFHDTTNDPRIRRAGKIAITLLLVVLIGGRILQRNLPGLASDLVGGIGYVWLGLALFLALGFLAVDLVRGIGRVAMWSRRRRDEVPDRLVLAALGSTGIGADAGPDPDPARSDASGTAADLVAISAEHQTKRDHLDARAATVAPETARVAATSASGDAARPDVDSSRRLFLARASAGSAAVVASSFAGYGAWRAYHPPEVTEVALKVPKLPKALDGFTIVQLSDVHVGNMIEKKFLEELVRRANGAKPDLVAITGDLVDGDVETLAPSVAALRGLNARYGTHFITGNHEYYSGASEWTSFLPSLGINVLRNRRVTIGDPGASFELAGVDDWSAGKSPGHGDYDLDAALKGNSPDAATVLLAHQPSNFDVARTKGVDVQLSGHTHGGQLFPMTMLIGLGWQYAAGHYQRGDAHIYVSRGCGFWGPPMRVGSPPEIVKVILTT